MTRTAVLDFQGRNGLPADGNAGPETLAELSSLTAAVDSPRPAGPASVPLSSLGNREKALHERIDIINSAAAEWNVEPQLLAAIVHHEGGAYLDIRRSPNEVRDYAIGQLRGGSVGIAQIQIGTARRLLEELYGISGLDDETIAVNLIRHDDISIRLAAAYLASLRESELLPGLCGGRTTRELFILYAFDNRAGCVMRDYDFDSNRLAADVATDIGAGRTPRLSQAEVDNLLAREEFYASSWRQAGLVLNAK